MGETVTIKVVHGCTWLPGCAAPLQCMDRSEMGAWKFAGHFFTLLVGWTWYRFRGKRQGLCQTESHENTREFFFAENHIFVRKSINEFGLGLLVLHVPSLQTWQQMYCQPKWKGVLTHCSRTCQK